MAEITVTPVGETYRVTVTEGDTSTVHDVTVDESDVARLGNGASDAELIAASFRFLLDREPKESILSSFDLVVIGRYFPDYPSEVAGYL